MLTQSSLLSAIPGLRHGFTNKSVPKPEREALDRAAATGKQVHKADLIWADKLEKREREADAVATFTPGLPVGVYSADCTPLLVAARDESSNKIYAVMAIHAGWRGTALGIAGKAFREFVLTARKRCPNSRFFAAIGPCIGYEAFEVGEEVLREFPGAESRGLARFLREEEGRKKYLIDLPGENLRQIRTAAGELAVHLDVESLGLCTVKHEQQFPSHRRQDREVMGGILSFIAFSG